MLDKVLLALRKTKQLTLKSILKIKLDVENKCNFVSITNDRFNSNTKTKTKDHL